MTRVALLAASDPGHALPAIGLAAALGRVGAHVAVWTGAQHTPTAAAHDVALHALPGLPPSERDADLGYRFWGRAVELVPRLAPDLARWRPDVIVTDTLLRAGGLLGAQLGIPWVELVGHHLPDPADDLPPIGLGRRRPRTPLGRATDRRLVRLQRRSVAAGDDQARAAATSLGLTHLDPPAVRLLATLPGLERPRARWPAAAHVVGALAVDPALPELRPPPGTAPLVLVTDTTAAQVPSPLGSVALAGLVHLGVRLVVTSTRLPARDDGQVVVGAGPHRPLLAQAAVAISPGGGGFVAKAASFGVPLLTVPIQGDQLEAAARLRDSGAGVTIHPRGLGPRRLAWHTARLLADPRARRAAARLRHQAAELGPHVAAELVLRVAAGERPRSAGPGW